MNLLYCPFCGETEELELTIDGIELSTEEYELSVEKLVTCLNCFSVASLEWWNKRSYVEAKYTKEEIEDNKKCTDEICKIFNYYDMDKYK